jgi:hypothetical protein
VKRNAVFLVALVACGRIDFQEAFPAPVLPPDGGLSAAPAQEAYVKASNTRSRYYFGSSLSLSGDTLVVGAFGEPSAATGVNGNQADSSAPDAGAVYVFVRSGGTWTQQAYLKASNTDAGDLFGCAVSLDGDTLAVGAYSESSAATGINGNQVDNSAARAGAVYVFVRSGSTWTQQAYLKASNTDAGDLFGRSVSLSGDTLAVGAEGERSAATGVNGNQADDTAFEAGAAYVFVRTGTEWRQQAYIKASNTQGNDRFSSVSLSGDTLAVGAPGESSSATGINGNQADNNLSSSGAVYVFTRSGSTWRQQAYIKASNTGGDATFGRSLSLLGEALAVGAEGDASAATGVNGDQTDYRAAYSGAVYLFGRSGTTWTQQAYIKASNTESGDIFGFSVSLGPESLAIGAVGEGSAATGVNGDQLDNSVSSAGAVYTFGRSGTTWSQLSYVKASNTGTLGAFGSSVSLSGDTLGVAAPSESGGATGINGNQTDVGTSYAGAVYIFR